MTKPFLVPAMFDLPAKWIRPSPLCDSCHDDLDKLSRTKSEQQRIESAFKEAMITPRFRDRTFENFKVTDENRKAWEAARYFRVIGDGMGLMFFGPCGIGKTHLAVAIANANIGERSVLYVPVPELLAEIRSSMTKDKRSDRLEIAKRVELLVLDDIGAEKPSEWVQETVFV
ncbi:MAG TPA: ATP-binding protein, partial [bacterium]|nr:ATP-binding protein [bacterium]